MKHSRRPTHWMVLGGLLTACSASGQGGFSSSDTGASVTPPQGDAGTLDAVVYNLDIPPVEVMHSDLGAADVTSVYDLGVVSSADACTSDTGMCVSVPGGCGPSEVCGNGLDDNCNGQVDENCPCVPGTVQDCFLGPPMHRDIGACRSGNQRCEGLGEFGTWSACAGGIWPMAEVCNGLDNDCDGCIANGLCCHGALACPGPGDPRVPDGLPFTPYTLHGTEFYPGGDVRSWGWMIVGGPCDTLLPHPTYTFTAANTSTPVFTPTLSGDYTVTLTVLTTSGQVFTCTFVVHIAGPGLRVELCWDTSTTVDLDLYVHQPGMTGPWFSSSAGPNSSVNLNSCNWSDCEATIRGSMGRANWGYANTPVANCIGGPHGAQWAALGYCSNPRLDVDNNLVESIGTPENINMDDPRDGQLFRVMVQNFTGTEAHPMVNIYCGGHLRATLGAPPDTLPSFTGDSGFSSVGTMWRAADVTVHVDATGATTGCDVTPLHPAGMSTGYWVTMRDPSY